MSLGGARSLRVGGGSDDMNLTNILRQISEVQLSDEVLQYHHRAVVSRVGSG